ncbi:MAG: contractile injection system tape measure protein, partial [Methylobacter sp.]
QIDGMAWSVSLQNNGSMLSHLELFEHFVREGYLPWWADNSQRQLPEKSFAVLLNSDANALKQLLSGLVIEPRCLQRLIGYFDDNHLLAMMVLLTGATEDSAASLVQMLSAIQTPLHRLSRMPVSHLRETLWQSLLQVAVTATPVISSHSEFLTAVTVRWAKLQNLPHTALAGCLQELATSPAEADNEWLQAAKLSAEVTLVLAEESTGDDGATLVPLLFAKSRLASEISALSPMKDTAGNRINHSRQPALVAISSRYAIVKKMRFTQSKSGREAKGRADNPMTDRFSPLVVNGKKAIINKPGLTQSQSADEPEPPALAQATNTLSKSTAVRRKPAVAMSRRYAIHDKLSALRLKPENEAPIDSRNMQPAIDTVADDNHAATNSPDSTAFKRAHDLSVADVIGAGSLPNRYRLASASSRRRYEMVKSNYAASLQKSADAALTESANIKQQLREPEKNDSWEKPVDIEQASARSSFSDTDALYINNAGLCLLWPFLTTFFERLELVQNGRFYNASAKQCAVSLLHYLATEELDPPEYLLPFNKLLCAMEIDQVFALETPLTTAQTEACDELLSAVIGHAPILNDMSINGFRGSFLLRRGSLSSDAGSWLLRVERETYDVVLERFPWSWQWFKLPWMEYPIRVEW